MENNLQHTPVNNLPNDFVDDVLDEFDDSIAALSLYNAGVSELSLTKAKNIYKLCIKSNGVATEESRAVKVIVDFIEMAYRVVTSFTFALDERIKKSVEELHTAKNIIENVKKEFENDFLMDILKADTYDFLKFMFFYYERIIVANYNIYNKTLDIIDGKYVNEVEMYKDAAAELRKINEITIEADNEVYYKLVGMLTQFADTYEKKAERVAEKLKKIDFMRPVDKKVFIAHGHNEALLRELQKMLEEVGITPVILKDEDGDGKTIIEKFENSAQQCAFAFILVNADDCVEVTEGNKKIKQFQPRPNVLFELGWFCGRFGRNKVRILKQRNTEMPSDLNGLETIEFTNKLEEEYRKIISNLKNSGVLEKDILVK